MNVSFQKNPGKKNQSNDTLIGKGVRMVGLIEFEGNLHIYGNVEGDIVSRNDGGYVYLGSGARVNGKVSSAQMEIHGHIEGDIYCAERLLFGPDGSCNGDVHYNNLQIETGAKVSGRMVRADNPQVAIESKPNANNDNLNNDGDLIGQTDADL